MSQLAIYRSSAGSGKTYTLTREYLAIVLKEPDRFRNVLAVTFTNKATDEMKRRIVKELHDMSLNRKTIMRSELSAKLGYSEEELTGRAQKALAKILHNFSFFSISTIDSFFQQIIRAFAREAGLHLGFKLELDQAKVMNEVVDQLLVDMSENKQLTEWLTRFAEEKVEEGKAWDFRRDIKGLATEVFKEQFKLFENELLGSLNKEGFMDDLQRKLHAIRNTFEAQMQAFGEKGMYFMGARNLIPADFKHGKTSFATYFQKLVDNRMEEPGARVLKAAGNPEEWYAKTSDRETDILAGYPELNQMLTDALAYRKENLLKYNSAQEVLQFIYTFGILSDVLRNLQKYRDEQSVVLISDSSYFLKSIVNDNDSSFIYEKAGNIYKYFLVDEFQDTSGFQWDNLKPLIRNSLAEGHRNLVVGDVKQSIYRWRGGDWSLLLEQIEKDINPFPTTPEVLNVNWRSRKNIIYFNNALFKAASGILGNIVKEELSAGDGTLKYLGDTIEKAYNDVKQELPEGISSDGGLVQVEFLDAENRSKEEQARQVLDKTVKLIGQLQDKKFTLKDIAILVRNRKEGRQIAAHLAKQSMEPIGQYRYDVISAESLFLSSSPAVRLLVWLMCYLTKPYDPINRAELLTEYLIYLDKDKSGTPDLDEIFTLAGGRKKEDEDALEILLPKEFTQHKAFLNKLSLFELTEKLIDIFNLKYHRESFSYLQGFQDCVLEYSRTEKPDITSFLEWWKESGIKKSLGAPEQQDAIQILTIHKSKGLQFKAVIVPYCSWELKPKGSQAGVLWCDTDTEPFNDVRYLPLRYRSKLKDTLYDEHYYRELLQNYLDNLNLLYVALTRAEDALMLIAPKPKDADKGPAKLNTVGDLLYKIIGEEKELMNLRFNSASQSYVTEPFTGMAVSETKNNFSNLVVFDSYPSYNWRERLSIRQHSKDFFLEKKSATTEKINYGTLMHELLSAIDKQSDVERNVHQFFFEGRITEEEKNFLLVQLNKLLEQPPLADWFSDHWKVKNETPILQKNKAQRIPDRVLLNEDKAIVIDFKFGGQKPDHQRQVQGYAALLNEMGYEHVEKYLVYFQDEENLSRNKIVTVN